MMFMMLGICCLQLPITDGDSGNYCFEDVPAGEYVVFEIQPAIIIVFRIMTILQLLR